MGDVARVCQPSTLRMLIWPQASNAPYLRLYMEGAMGMNRTFKAAVAALALAVSFAGSVVEQLTRAQPMAVGQQDHGGVPMTVPVASGRGHERFDLVRGQVLAGPQLGVRPAQRRDCPIFGGWRDQSQVRFYHRKSPCPEVNCPKVGKRDLERASIYPLRSLRAWSRSDTTPSSAVSGAASARPLGAVVAEEQRANVVLTKNQ
jgi:hypothetical protein